MRKFQVQYRYETSTLLIDLYAPTYSDVLSLFQDISACEVTEIREYKYEDDVKIKDDGDYVKYATFLLTRDSFLQSVKIPKIKKQLFKNIKVLESIVLQYIEKNSIKYTNIKTKFSS